MAAIKQFTLKEINKRFTAQYPDGELYKDGTVWSYTDDTSKRMNHLYRIDNYYDLALELNLASQQEVSDMKRAAGYHSYQ